MPSERNVMKPQVSDLIARMNRYLEFLPRGWNAHHLDIKQNVSFVKIEESSEFP